MKTINFQCTGTNYPNNKGHSFIVGFFKLEIDTTPALSTFFGFKVMAPDPVEFEFILRQKSSSRNIVHSYC